MKKIISIMAVAFGASALWAQTQNVTFDSAADSTVDNKPQKVLFQTLNYLSAAKTYVGYSFTNDFVYRGVSHNDWSHQVKAGFETDALQVVDVAADVLANFGQDGNDEIQTTVAVKKDFYLYDRITVTPFVAWRNYSFSGDLKSTDEILGGIQIDPQLYGIKGSINVFRGVHNSEYEGIEGSIYRTFCLDPFKLDLNETENITESNDGQQIVLKRLYHLYLTPYISAGAADIYSWATIGIQGEVPVYQYRTLTVIASAGFSASFNDIKTESDPVSFNIGLQVNF